MTARLCGVAVWITRTVPCFVVAKGNALMALVVVPQDVADTGRARSLCMGKVPAKADLRRTGVSDTQPAGKRLTKRCCQGVSTARASYRSRTKATASRAGTPSSTARQASAVPVRPRPPPQAISTRSTSARRQPSRSASCASFCGARLGGPAACCLPSLWLVGSADSIGLVGGRSTAPMTDATCRKVLFLVDGRRQVAEHGVQTVRPAQCACL